MRRSIAWVLVVGCVGCSSAAGTDATTPGSGGAAGTDAGSTGGSAVSMGGANAAGGDASGNGGGITVGNGGNAGPTMDPTTCADAAATASYVGCDFWPTVVDNIVRALFDYAVVVVNTGDQDADVTVTQGGMTIQTATAPANGVVKIYLPWVEALKSTSWIPGKPDNGCPTWAKTNTVYAKDGAYHLTSTRPVAVYQFNAIEYQGKGGPPGKDWSACKLTCGQMIDCDSYTNDASLLLPSTALTGAYRVAGVPAWKDTTDSDPNDPTMGFTFPPYFAVTGTQDGTMVTVQLSSTATIAGGSGLASANAGDTVQFVIGAGDVAEIFGAGDMADFSGTLVTASAPIQVVAGISCTQMPHGTPACDHVEESVLPVETLGKHYFVAPPSSADGSPASHVVRIYGNVDGTSLTYPGSNPGGPSTINAGDVADLGVVTSDFEIVADHEITIGTFMVGEGPVMNSRVGDPSQSFAIALEQYRTKYVFLAPDDYEVSFADVIEPMDATLTLDGMSLGVTPEAISSGYGVARVQLQPTNGGAHVLTSSAPVGIQVIGYGSYTSYQYPGGLNLGKIAPIPLK